MQSEAWELYITSLQKNGKLPQRRIILGYTIFQDFPEPGDSMESFGNKVIQVNLQFLQASQISKWRWNLSTEIIIFQMPSQEEKINSIFDTS